MNNNDAVVNTKSWDTFFIEMAMHVATKSKDPSTQVGCILVGADNEVLSTGFNGFPRGVEEVSYGARNPHWPVSRRADIARHQLLFKCSCGAEVDEDDYTKHVGKGAPGVRLSDRWERPAKYEWVEHAERNAVYNAARNGIATKGAKAYLNWAPTPCVECTKGLIQAGITEVIGPAIPFPLNKDWKFDISKALLAEGGLKTREVAWT